MAIFDPLLNLIRPRWKHTDPEVRTEAARHEDSARVLAEILRTDKDIRVRRVALKKVSDPDVLALVAESDTDEALRRAAAEKATEVLTARAVSGDEAALARLSGAKAIAEVAKSADAEPIRRAALGRLTEEKSFVDVAKNANDPATRRLAVDKIYDGNALRDIAINDPAKEVSLAAVEKIEEASLLETVFKRGKSKAVRDAARERLPQTMGKVELTTRATPLVDPNARQHARQAQIVREIDQLTSSSEWDETAQAIQTLRAEWQSLGGGDADAKKKLERTIAKFEVRKKAHFDVLHAHADALEAQKRRAEEEQKQIDAAAKLVAEVDALDGEAIRDGLVKARDAFRELGQLPLRGKEVEHAFVRAGEAAQKRADLGLARAKLGERLEELALEAEALAPPLKEAEGKLKALGRKLRELEAMGVNEAIRARFAKVEERLAGWRAEDAARRAAEDAQTLERLDALCAKLETLASSDDKKGIEHELKVVEGAFESAGSGVRGDKGQAVRDRFRAARDKVVAKLAEAREAEHWKRWANVPRLEKLCERMEALKDVVEVKEATAQMKALQAEWKTMGPAPKERSEQLWARFKAAGDEVYKKTHEGFEKVEAERAENLAKKEALCVSVETLVEAFFSREAAAEAAAAAAAPAPVATPIDAAVEAGAATGVVAATAVEPAPETASAKETGEKIKALQAEWKAIGPAPKDSADAIWKRFRASCDRFFEKRNAEFSKERGERGENLKKLEELIARVAQLADSTDWKGAGDEIKAAQADWKLVGPAPRKESEAAWTRFREACDRFFERRKSHFDQLDEERGENARRKEALCVKADELATSLEAPDSKKTRDEAMREAKALQADWKKIGPVPREHGDELWTRFRGACDKIFHRGDAVPMPVDDVPAPEGDPSTWPKFANKINLDGVLAKLQPGDDQPASDEENAGDEKNA